MSILALLICGLEVGSVPAGLAAGCRSLDCELLALAGGCHCWVAPRKPFGMERWQPDLEPAVISSFSWYLDMQSMSVSSYPTIEDNAAA